MKVIRLIIMNYTLWLYFVTVLTALLGLIVSVHPAQSQRAKTSCYFGFFMLVVFGGVLVYYQAQENKEEKGSTQEALGHWIVDFATPTQGYIENLVRISENEDAQVADYENTLRVASSPERERAKRLAIRNQLALYVKEGEDLKRQCRREINAPPPLPEADRWTERVNKYLMKKVSAADAVQFLNPTQFPSSSSIPESHERLVYALEQHIVVLRQIMARQASS